MRIAARARKLSHTTLLVGALSAIAVSAVGCRAGSGRPDGTTRAAERLDTRLEPVLTSSPHRAAQFARAADGLAPSVGTELGMLSVATHAVGVDRVLQAQIGPVTAIARFKDTVITAGRDDSMRVWDAATGAQLAQRKVATPIVQMATSDALDSELLTADSAGRVALWDLSDPAAPTVRGLPTPVLRSAPILVGFLNEGVLAFAVWPDGTIRRWDVASASAVTTLHLQDASGSVAWHGRKDALRVEAATMLDAYDATLLLVAAGGAFSEVDLRTLYGHRVGATGKVAGAVTSLAGVTYGANRFVATTANAVLTWNTKSHSFTEEATPNANVVLSGDTYYIADGRGVETSNADDEATPVQPPELPAGTVAAAGPGGVAIGHADGTVSLLASRTGGNQLELDPGENRSLARFMPNGLLLTTDGYDANNVNAVTAVRLGAGDPATTAGQRHVKTYKPSRSWWPQGADSGGGWYINDADASDDLVVAAGQDPTRTASIVVWDARTARPVKRLALTTGGVTPNEAAIVSQVRLLPRKELLAAYGAVQETLVLWSTKTWQRVATIPVGPAGDFTVLPDESKIVVAGLSDDQARTTGGYRTSRLEFIDVDRRKIDHIVNTRSSARVEAAPDGHALATVDNGQLRILTPDGRRDLRRPLDLETTLASAIAWRPDSRVIAIARLDDGTAIVNAAGGEIAAALPSPNAGNSIPFSLSWSPSGGMLVATNGQENQNGRGFSPIVPSFWRLNRKRLRARMCELGAGGLSTTAWRAAVGAGVPFQRSCSAGAARRPTAPRAPQHPVVAFMRGNVVWAAGDDGRAAVIGRFPQDEVTTETLTVGPNGAVAWVAGKRLHLVREGVARSWVCACNSVVLDGDSVAAITVDGSEMVHFDVDADSPIARRLHGLPRNSAELVAIHGVDALVAGFSRPPDRNEPTTLVALHNGRVRAQHTRSVAWPSSAPVTSPDGRDVAFRTSPSNGACYPTDGVAVVDVATARLSRPALPPDVKNPHMIRSISWPADGVLSAVVSRSDCNPNGGALRWAPPGQLLRLDNRGRFGRAPQRDYDIAVRPGITARLTGRVPADRLTAQLVLERPDGKVTHVADGVSTMALRP